MVLGALLAGLETVGDCIQDETVNGFLRTCLFDEILVTIGDSEDNRKFASDVLERFANPYIKHQLRSIALNSVSKFSVRVLPTILEYKALKGGYPKALPMSLALLIYSYKNDVPQDLPEVMHFMKTASVGEILSNAHLWGQDISDMEEDVNRGLNIMESLGAKKGMQWIQSS